MSISLMTTYSWFCGMCRPTNLIIGEYKTCQEVAQMTGLNFMGEVQPCRQQMQLHCKSLPGTLRVSEVRAIPLRSQKRL